MVLQLWLGAQSMGDAAQFDTRFKRRSLRIFLASVAMGLVLILAANALAPALAMGYWRYLALLALIVIGAVTYFGIGQIIGALRLSDFKSALRRGRA